MQFSKIYIYRKSRDQAEYLHVFKPICVFKPGCVTSTISRQVTVTSSSVISTEQNNYRNIYRKNKCTIQLKPCMYSCRDVLHPQYGFLKTLNRLLFNENDKQFQCRCALLHNHTTFMCKSNHTNECNTITSEVVSMITTLSDLFRLNIKWVANRILCRQPFQNFEEKNRNSSVVRFPNEHTALVLF